jgi:hypothetical protein
MRNALIAAYVIDPFVEVCEERSLLSISNLPVQGSGTFITRQVTVAITHERVLGARLGTTRSPGA